MFMTAKCLQLFHCCCRGVTFIVALSRFCCCHSVVFIITLSWCCHHSFVVAITVSPLLSHCHSFIVAVAVSPSHRSRFHHCHHSVAFTLVTVSSLPSQYCLHCHFIVVSSSQSHRCGAFIVTSLRFHHCHRGVAFVVASSQFRRCHSVAFIITLS